MCYSHSCLAFAYSAAVRCKSARETYVSGSHKPQTGLHPPRFGVDKMEQLLTAVIVAPFVITMVGFAVAIAFAPAVPNEIAPATDHDHDSRQLHRAKPRRWSGKA
jgi:hypothetical protein